jgi:hypothetical protein
MYKTQNGMCLRGFVVRSNRFNLNLFHRFGVTSFVRAVSSFVPFTSVCAHPMSSTAGLLSLSCVAGSISAEFGLHAGNTQFDAQDEE